MYTHTSANSLAQTSNHLNGRKELYSCGCGAAEVTHHGRDLHAATPVHRRTDPGLMQLVPQLVCAIRSLDHDEKRHVRECMLDSRGVI
jgi:hypothetical protein